MVKEHLRDDALIRGCPKGKQNPSLSPRVCYRLKQTSREKEKGEIFEEFWQQWSEHRDLLYRCCLKLMNFNPTDAEDALSRAMLHAWEKMPQGSGEIANFKAWLMRLTRNLCIDIQRENSRGPVGVENIEWVGDTKEMVAVSSMEAPQRVIERQEKSKEIRRAIADLPEKMRETFILHFYEELTHIEIVERQGISYDNVCKRVSQARKKLKENLRGYFQESESEVRLAPCARRTRATPGEYGEKQKKMEPYEKKGLE